MEAAGMQIVASAPATMGLDRIGGWSQRVERIGFDVMHISETIHDPFVLAATALAHTERMTVRTSMALAFPRSPMVIAYSAWDLAKYSGGRFELGIATQVKGNMVGRFSVPWDEPVARLGDYIGSLRAIFRSFHTGEPLDHDGQFYRFTRLQPYFNPGPIDHPAPLIWTGGVNPKMCVLAGEAADGFVCHPTNSHPEILAARTLPAIAQGARTAQRDVMPAVVANPQPLIAGSRAELAEGREARRSELAFLYSTPAYRRQLEHFGLAEVGAALSDMAHRREWDGLSHHLSDDVMNRLLPQGTYQDIPEILAEWYSGLCAGLVLPVPDHADDDGHLAEVVEKCRAIPPAARSVC